MDSAQSSTASEIETGLNNVVARLTSTHPEDALDTYRALWQEHATSDTESAIETHEKHREAELALLQLFDAKYRDNAPAELKANINALRNAQSPWREALQDLRLYVHFGADGVTRRFLGELRALSQLRTPRQHNEASPLGQEGENNDERARPRPSEILRFSAALPLLKEAQNERRGGLKKMRGPSIEKEWQPADCMRAAELAQTRWGMTPPPSKPKTARKSKVTATQGTAADINAPATDSESVSKRTQGDIGDGNGGGGHEHSAAEERGSRAQSAESTSKEPDRERSPERARRADAPDLQDDTSEPQDLTFGSGLADDSVAFLPRPSLPHLPPPHQPPQSGNPRHQSLSLDSTTDQDNADINPDLNDEDFDPPPPDSPVRRSPSPLLLQKSRLPRPTNIEQTRDSTMNSNTAMSSTGAKRQRIASATEWRPPVRENGVVSAFKRTRLSADRDETEEEGHLVLAQKFLSCFAPGAAPVIHDSERLVVVNVEDSLTTVLVDSLDNGVLQDPDTTSNWVLLHITHNESDPATIEIHAGDALVSRAAATPDLSTSVQAWLHRVFPGPMLATSREIPIQEYQWTRLPTTSDMRDDDPTDFLKCLAANVHMIMQRPLPADVAIWAWTGALANVTSTRNGRVSDVERAVELPYLVSLPSLDLSEQTSATALGASLRYYRSTLDTLRRLATTLSGYLSSLRGIRHLARIAAKAKSSLSTSATSDLDGELETLAAIIAKERSDAVRRLLQQSYDAKKQEKDTQADHNGVKAMQELMAWADLSIGSAEGEKKDLKEWENALLERVRECTKLTSSILEDFAI